MAEKEYVLFLDESERKGAFYSNFYGGLIVGASQYQHVTNDLNAKKTELNLFAETKWSKVSEPYLGKYVALVQSFFMYVAAGSVRMRVMFRQNAHVPQNLARDQIETEYFRLYYQFVKHAFGFAEMPAHPGPVNLRLYFDELPDTHEKRQQFRGYILGLGANAQIASRGLNLSAENITEVRSHDHVLLQCLDIVLGAVVFRLNNKHLEKPPGQRRRGKKTIAKESLYRAVLAEIRKLRPGFNIGISTGIFGIEAPRWSEPYLHWKFVPKDAVWDSSKTKHRK